MPQSLQGVFPSQPAVRALSFVFGCLFFVLTALPARSGEEPAPPAKAASPYAASIEKAANELERLEREESAKESVWTFSDALMLAALVAAFGFMIWTIIRMRRFGRIGPGAGAGKQLRIIEAQALGGNAFLLLVEAKSRYFLLARHPQGIALLAELSENSEKSS